jgi:hypothetical protein
VNSGCECGGSEGCGSVDGGNCGIIGGLGCEVRGADSVCGDWDNGVVIEVVFQFS